MTVGISATIYFCLSVSLVLVQTDTTPQKKQSASQPKEPVTFAATLCARPVRPRVLQLGEELTNYATVSSCCSPVPFRRFRAEIVGIINANYERRISDDDY
jgi:hypothetical protein